MHISFLLRWLCFLVFSSVFFSFTLWRVIWTKKSDYHLHIVAKIYVSAMSVHMSEGNREHFYLWCDRDVDIDRMLVLHKRIWWRTVCLLFYAATEILCYYIEFDTFCWFCWPIYRHMTGMVLNSPCFFFYHIFHINFKLNSSTLPDSFLIHLTCLAVHCSQMMQIIRKNFKNKCASSSKSLFLLLKSMAMIPIWLWLNYKILSKNSIEMFAVLYVQNFHDMELVYVCFSFCTYA